MADQPSYYPLRPSSFFANGRSARPLLPGTVDRTSNFDDLHTIPQEGADVQYATEFPAGVLGNNDDERRAALERGRERFNIFCSVCHDETGHGNGKIVERGYTRPPDYHTAESRGLARLGKHVLLRDAPVGYYYEVITNGYGAMADYSAQVRPDDRWKIIAWIRVLQLSQYAPLDRLPESERAAVRKELEGPK